MAVTHSGGKEQLHECCFIDNSSAFNTIVPSKLDTKLRALGLDTTLCNWILDFLMDRPQAVRIGNNSSSALCCTSSSPMNVWLCNSIIKFANDTTIGGLINNEESVYRGEVSELALW